jgi:signal transduction histidine kinase/predicted CoA-binding protein
MYDFLKKVPLFANLPEDDLARLCEMVEEVQIKAGEELFSEGARGDRAYVIQDGQLEILKNSGGRQVLISVRGSGDVIGEMALLEDSPRSASVRARTDAILLAIHQEQLDQLLDSSGSAAKAMLHTVLNRFRHTSSALRQSEKMAQLGTFTAGIAHELNNPAAAVKRGAGQLKEIIEQYGRAEANMGRWSLSLEQKQALAEHEQHAQAVAARPPDIDPLARSDQEYEIESWLDGRGVEDAWELAPLMVNIGYDNDQLDHLGAGLTGEQLHDILRWLGMTFSIYNLLAEISSGAARISDIVAALKSYSYLDQAPVQPVDIAAGLDNTLLILRHKLKNITVRKDYAADLPRINGYGSELNQVWTNLIDNAADALAETPNPTILLSATRQGDWITVAVEDNGPGIPPEIQPRIFDAFFTTKPPGKGTGLGLDISYNIVVNKHRGDIKVFSRPGRTCFQISLPTDFETMNATPAPAALNQTNDSQLRRILETTKTIAVVGASSRPDRPGYTVPAYLQKHGYRIIPVNPSLTELLGEKAYPDLLAIPEPVDVVEIFRPGDEVLPVVQQAIAIGAKVVWMQETVVNEQAADLAKNAGLEVVMDVCMRAAHRRLFGKT